MGTGGNDFKSVGNPFIRSISGFHNSATLMRNRIIEPIFCRKIYSSPGKSNLSRGNLETNETFQFTWLIGNRMYINRSNEVTMENLFDTKKDQ